MSKFALQFSKRAINVKKSLGVRTAAGYLRNKGVSLQDALFLLTGRVS